MQSYRELIVWQRSIHLVSLVYALTARFPKSELFGLTSQMRRAAVSVPSNIAEGFSRKHRPEYIQFLRIAFGSGAELETQLHISTELKFVSEKEKVEVEQCLSEIMRMLNKLIASLVAKP
ncbi:four helix bundle protein [Candidatus Kaiserbacteria bacterium]|nr:four helix bundle protein [Candidatus Kaiserbacteria bacterium]